MPSFDIVSEIDMHEVDNAVDQANREIGTRYDFKGTDARVTREEDALLLEADSDFRIDQMRTLLYTKLAKRGVDIMAIEEEEPKASGQRVRQRLKLRHGIDRDTAKKIVRLIKDTRRKVQASVQGEQIRVSGKKRDDLQAIIALLREQKETLGLPLQFTNFRD